MSDEIKPVVEGKSWPIEVTINTAFGLNADAANQCSSIATGCASKAYCYGQQDMVDAGYKDMSHYRRRPNTETPRPPTIILLYGTQHSTDVFSGEYVASGNYIDSGDYTISMNDVKWWAYAFLPKE